MTSSRCARPHSTAWHENLYLRHHLLRDLAMAPGRGRLQACAQLKFVPVTPETFQISARLCNVSISWTHNLHSNAILSVRGEVGPVFVRIHQRKALSIW